MAKGVLLKVVWENPPKQISSPKKVKRKEIILNHAAGLICAKNGLKTLAGGS
jgi:hypothetical protein